MSNVKCEYPYNTCKKGCTMQKATAVISMAHPSRSAKYLNSKFREWGVVRLEIVKVVNVVGMGRGLSALKKIPKSHVICGYARTHITDDRNPHDEIYQYQDVRTGKYVSIADYLGVIQFGILANHSFKEGW